MYITIVTTLCLVTASEGLTHGHHLCGFRGSGMSFLSGENWFCSFFLGLVASGLGSGAQRLYRDSEWMKPLTLGQHFTGKQHPNCAGVHSSFSIGAIYGTGLLLWRQAAALAACVDRHWKSVLWLQKDKS